MYSSFYKIINIIVTKLITCFAYIASEGRLKNLVRIIRTDPKKSEIPKNLKKYS